VDNFTAKQGQRPLTINQLLPNKMMKVLLLNTQMAAGGAQKAMLTLARGLNEAGHTVTVVTMYDIADYVPLFEAQYGLEIIDLRMKGDNGRYQPIATLFASLRGLYRLYRLMRQTQPDVVQTFTHYSNIIGPPIAWLARVPWRVSSQRNLLYGRSQWLLTADRLVANAFFVHKMSAVSDETRQFCIEQGIQAAKLHTIYSGIDAAQYHCALTPEQKRRLRQNLGIGPTAPVILTVARLFPQKGHRYLLEAAPIIREAIPDAHFLLVGEGDLQASLTQQINAAGLESYVHLLGARQDIPQLLAISQLFILPSLYEGLPNVLLEALAAGVPVVATDLGGCREIITNGQDGMLVPAGNAAALAQAAITVLQDPRLAASLQQAGRQRVIEDFSIDKSVAAYISLYEQLLGAKTKGGNNR
jgi:L-malate glycosyltransferase